MQSGPEEVGKSQRRWMEFRFDYYEPYQGRIQDSRSLVLCSALKQAILESNFTAFYLVPSREEVRRVAGRGRGVEGSRR